MAIGQTLDVLKPSKANYMPPLLFITVNDIHSCVLKYKASLFITAQELYIEII